MKEKGKELSFIWTAFDCFRISYILLYKIFSKYKWSLGLSNNQIWVIFKVVYITIIKKRIMSLYVKVQQQNVSLYFFFSLLSYQHYQCTQIVQYPSRATLYDPFSTPNIVGLIMIPFLYKNTKSYILRLIKKPYIK